MMDRAEQNSTFDPAQLVIRQVTKADLPAMEWDGDYKKYRRMYANLYRNTITGRSLMWIIETAAGQVIGQAFVMLKSGEQDAADGKIRAYIFAFRVKPQWRNLGIGSYLMQFVENDLQQRGFSYVTLNVAKDNPQAIRLYQRLGYKIIGSRSGIWTFIDDQGKLQHVNEPAWRMMKRIKSA